MESCALCQRSSWNPSSGLNSRLCRQKVLMGVLAGRLPALSVPLSVRWGRGSHLPPEMVGDREVSLFLMTGHFPCPQPTA